MPRGGTGYKADGVITIGTSVDVGGINTGLNSITKSMRKLSRLSATLVGGGLFGMLTKSAIDAASNLQEVQNIVDRTFGKLSYKMEEFAKNSIEMYGLSEYTSKYMAGSFMAMGKAAGFAQEQAAEMAITLTGLAGDFSSFYNISHDYARVALSAVYTGETETLKRYGIILTEANLQQYALDQGIQKAVHSMNAAEKVQLRYNYIMQQTNFLQGDFVQTSANWANQTRVLKERWNQLLIVLGNGVIKVLNPVVKVLNAIVQALTKLTKTVGRTLTTMFGITWEGVSGSLSDTAENATAAADAEEALADATEAAGKAAKGSIAPFDKLNLITTRDDSGSGDDADIDVGQAEQAADALNSIQDQIEEGFHSLRALGLHISTEISQALESINWEAAYQGARNFGTNLAEYMNGLITPRLFSGVAQTIAGALNTALYAVFEFGKAFDFENLGNAIATGINKFFSTYDFSTLGQTVMIWVRGLLDAIITILEDTDWELVGKKLGQFLEQIDLVEIIGKVFKAAFLTLKGLLQGWINSLLVSPLNTMIVTAFILPKAIKALAASKLVTGFKDIFATTKKGIEKIGGFKLGGKFISALTSDFKVWKTLFGDIGRTVKLTTTQLVKKQVPAFSTISGSVGLMKQNLTDFRNSLSKLGKGLVGVGGIAASFLGVRDAISDCLNGTKNLGEAIGEIAISAGLSGAAMAAVFGPAGIVVAALTGLIGAFQAISEYEAKKLGQAVFDNISNPNGVSVQKLCDETGKAILGLGDNFAKVSDKANELHTINDNIDSIVQDIRVWTEEYKIGVLTHDEYIEKLRDSYERLENEISLRFETMRWIVTAAFSSDGYIIKALQNAGYTTDETTSLINSDFDSLHTQVKNLLQQIKDSEGSPEKVAELTTKIYNLISSSGELGVSMQNLNLQISKKGLNWEAFYDPDKGEITKEKVEAALSGVGSAITEISDTADSHYSELGNTLELSANGLRIWGQIQGDVLDGVNNDVDTRLTTLENTLKTQLIDKLNTLDKDASENWDNMSFWEKLKYGSYENYANEQLQAFVDDYYTPLGEGLKSYFEELGYEGHGWSSEAYQNALLYGDGITRNTGGGNISLSGDFEKNYSTIKQLLSGSLSKGIQDAEAEVKPISAMAGKNIITSTGTGITQGTKSLKTPVDSAFSTMNTNILNNKSMPYSGNTNTTTLKYGKQIVGGLEKGISESTVSSGVINKMFQNLNNQLQIGLQTIVKTFDTLQTKLPQSFSTASAKTTAQVKNMISTINTQFNGLKSSLTQAATAAVNGVTNAFNTLPSRIRGSLNGMLDVIQSAVNCAIYGVNSAIDALNSASYTIPRWVPNYGGKRFSLDMGYVGNVWVPRLAQGAVIPPNKEFMAILGDQKHGTNIETPLNTMIEAFNKALDSRNGGSGNSGDIVIQIDGNEVFRAVRNQNEQYIKRTGSSAFE